MLFFIPGSIVNNKYMYHRVDKTIYSEERLEEVLKSKKSGDCCYVDFVPKVAIRMSARYYVTKIGLYYRIDII